MTNEELAREYSKKKRIDKILAVINAATEPLVEKIEQLKADITVRDVALQNATKDDAISVTGTTIPIDAKDQRIENLEELAYHHDEETGVEISYKEIADDLKSAIDLKDQRIKELAEECNQYRDRNERVSVCRDHVDQIVDGLCAICRIEKLESTMMNQDNSIYVQADYIDALKQRIAELKAALKPFAEIYEDLPEGIEDDDSVQVWVLMESLFDAAEAVRGAKREP